MPGIHHPMPVSLAGEPVTTINDVAKRAGVAPVTVSRVINGAPNVNLSTRARVERAIAELGYVPNIAARSLRSRRTRSLALVLPDITNTFWTTVARGIEDAAQDRGYTVLLCNTDENAAKQASYLELAASQRADGVIIAPCDADPDRLQILRDRDIPTVIIDRRVAGWEVDSVLGDSMSGAHALTSHLIGLGHRRIAIISGPRGASTAEDRVAGYSRALAEAGIAAAPELIRYGEYRSASGERLAAELLHLPVRPTAVFAANNAIAMGVIDAVGRRGLRIPHDVALVCFDDLANASHIFPFLTVAVQPAYDMGLHAAQLLLSRLDATVTLKPRRVVLPCRLIIRHSCGVRLAQDGAEALSLPLAGVLEERAVLVRPLHEAERSPGGGNGRGSAQDSARTSFDKSDVNRLLLALNHQEADRIPHLEFSVTSKAVYEYVLERELKREVTGARAGWSVAPEDDVEFARRLGMDAVTCDFSWRPGNRFARAADGVERVTEGNLRDWPDLDDLEPPPLTDQLSHLERYLRAAQGTGVGVCASFTSFFDSALRGIGLADALEMLRTRPAFVTRLMDIVLAHQAHVVRAVCDRFADDLALVLINDDVADQSGLLVQPDRFMELFVERMRTLMQPACEHGKVLALHSGGRIGELLPALYDLGFGAIHPVDPACNDIYALRETWRGKLAFIGNIPATLLSSGSAAAVTAAVQEACLRLGPGGGYVLGSASGIIPGVSPARFVAMTQATHADGRYDLLRQLTFSLEETHA
jgi:LacI family transcriptional regulator